MRGRNIVRHVRICLLLCSGFASAQTATTTSLASSPNPANLGQVVTLTATVTTGATGKVTFYDGTTILGVSAISGGQASWSTVLLPSDARSLRAYYQGDAGHATSSSAVLAETLSALPSLGLRVPVAFAVGTNPISSVVGDFNADEMQDLAVANANEGGASISVLLGAGMGGFQPAVNYSLPTTPRALAIGDFNGDGKPDFVVSSGSSLSLMLGNGEGTFQPAMSFLTGDFSSDYSLAVGDFNGDGNADFAFGGAAGVLILLGNGDGTFQAPMNLVLAGNARFCWWAISTAMASRI
jgi:hypothetical protein